MNMRISAYFQKQIEPPVNLQKVIHMNPFFRRKDKVVFVVGPTGTGKSKLAIDLATRIPGIPGEVINCDKMQVYKGLDILTNKVTEEECRGVPHHLIGVVEPNSNFTSDDFRRDAKEFVESIVARDRLPIIAGGSNSFIDALVNDDRQFRVRYDCFFLCVDVSLPVLDSFVSERVDRMVKSGLVNEAKKIFDPNNTNYSQGIRRAIGVPELDHYFRNEGILDAKTKIKILDTAIQKIKENTRILSRLQLQKIRKLLYRWSWNTHHHHHHINATEFFLKNGNEAEEVWEKLVAGPSTRIVEQFLKDEDPMTTIVPPEPVPTTIQDFKVPAMSASHSMKCSYW